MKRSCFVFIILVFVAACNSGLDKENYEKTKEDLGEKERKNPLTFLEVSGTDKRNIIGKTVINGKVQNKASVCDYKDVRIKMLFYKEGTLVANHEQVLDNIIKANNTHNFKSRYATPKGTDSVALSIMSAVAIEK